MGVTFDEAFFFLGEQEENFFSTAMNMGKTDAWSQGKRGVRGLGGDAGVRD